MAVASTLRWGCWHSLTRRSNRGSFGRYPQYSDEMNEFQDRFPTQTQRPKVCFLAFPHCKTRPSQLHRQEQLPLNLDSGEMSQGSPFYPLSQEPLIPDSQCAS